MYEVFMFLRELGIDWFLVNVNLDVVKENIDKNIIFVMIIDDEIIFMIMVRYFWRSVKSILGYFFVWWFVINFEYEGKGYGS